MSEGRKRHGLEDAVGDVGGTGAHEGLGGHVDGLLQGRRGGHGQIGGRHVDSVVEEDGSGRD